MQPFHHDWNHLMRNDNRGNVLGASFWTRRAAKKNGKVSTLLNHFYFLIFEMVLWECTAGGLFITEVAAF